MGLWGMFSYYEDVEKSLSPEEIERRKVKDLEFRQRMTKIFVDYANKRIVEGKPPYHVPGEGYENPEEYRYYLKLKKKYGKR